LIFTPTPLSGAFVVELEPIEDERGWFARSFDDELFQEVGLAQVFRQGNVSWNARAGTLRGMHYQVEPFAEAKLIRCTRGAIHDVIVDLRPASATYCRWFAVELTPENGRQLYAPEGMAHGFQTLVDGSEVIYQMSQVYSPQHARGVRWDDPAFGVGWPDAPKRSMSDRDLSYPQFVV
jgi:dTDP-4-dehydrorhamnose 3,5-epimerase